MNNTSCDFLASQTSDENLERRDLVSAKMLHAIAQIVRTAEITEEAALEEVKAYIQAIQRLLLAIDIEYCRLESDRQVLESAERALSLKVAEYEGKAD